MSERWKPARKDEYWLVDFGYSKAVRSMKWDDDDIDTRIHSSGNCFKTEEEAKAAAEKVKALLLGLHEPVTECNQMNRLTEDVFLLHTCPEWAKYVAVDSDGEARYHEREPEVADYWWVSSGNIRSVNYGKFDVSDWQNSVIERPVKLLNLAAEVFNYPGCPEWAKYASVDGNGCAYYYAERPSIVSDELRWATGGENTRWKLIPGKFTHINWKHSLIERSVKENKLPKLTTEVFDRPDCPQWAKYAAVDECGSVRLFSDAPWLGESCWNWSNGEVRQLFGVKFDASYWQRSRIKRPDKKTLPDWCKVGEWCYCLDDDGNPKYFKITTIKDNYIYGEDWDIDYHFVKQARLRPYNADEMKDLVGHTVDSDTGARYLVSKFYNTGGGEVCIDGIYYSADGLLAKFTIDNEPCGKLEHLNEKGEWVE